MPLIQNKNNHKHLKKILVFGEILFDVYPEAKHLGGAPLNFAYHLHQLGYSVQLLSAVGNDASGREILDFLTSRQMDSRLIQCSQDFPTGQVQVSLDERGIPDYEIVMPVAWDDIEWNHLVEKAAQVCDLLYFGSLSLRQEKSRNTLFRLMNQINQDTPVFFDINLRQNFYSIDVLEKCLKHCTVLKCNTDEFDLLSDSFSASGSEVNRLSRLRELFNINTIILTKGEKGSLVFDSKGVFELNLKSDLQNKVVDTVGAGDAFSALFIHGKLQQWDTNQALRRASDFASKICMINGALPKEQGLYNDFLS